MAYEALIVESSEAETRPVGIVSSHLTVLNDDRTRTPAQPVGFPPQICQIVGERASSKFLAWGEARYELIYVFPVFAAVKDLKPAAFAGGCDGSFIG